MQSIVDGDRYSLYRFDLVRYGQSDCELGHFYSHRHPEATFVNNLVASLILDDEVRSLRNREYWVIREDGTTTTVITSAEQLTDLLAAELGIRVSAAEGQRLFDELPTADPDGDAGGGTQAAAATSASTRATSSDSATGTHHASSPRIRALTASTMSWYASTGANDSTCSPTMQRRRLAPCGECRPGAHPRLRLRSGDDEELVLRHGERRDGRRPRRSRRGRRRSCVVRSTPVAPMLRSTRSRRTSGAPPVSASQACTW